MKKQTALHTKMEPNFIERFSSYTKLITFASCIMRSKTNFRLRKSDQPIITGPFTVKEQEQAFKSLCSYTQQQFFPKEFKLLSAGSPQNSESLAGSMRKSKLNNLDPFFDKENNVIRVGGRLTHAPLEYNHKFPIILPDGHLSRLYLLHLHTKLLHAGPTLLVANSRQKVWIITGKNAARQVVKNCITCARWSGQTFGQKMGNFPAARLQGLRAFHIVGVDYAGPLSLKHRKGRGVPTHKGWICLFVCLTTKAVHLEAVTALTTEAFIAALRRFIARRGKPVEIHSDNGTNFVGAEKELRQLLQQESTQLQLEKTAAEDGIQWHFIPPHAPHMGGLWESAVKSTKHHLRRV